MASRKQTAAVFITGAVGVGATIGFFAGTEHGSKVGEAVSFDSFMSSLESDEKALLGVGIAALILTAILVAAFVIYNRRAAAKDGL